MKAAKGSNNWTNITRTGLVSGGLLTKNHIASSPRNPATFDVAPLMITHQCSINRGMATSSATEHRPAYPATAAVVMEGKSTEICMCPQRFLHPVASSLASRECLWADSTLYDLDSVSLRFLNASGQSLCMPGRSLKEITMGYWSIGPFTSLDPRISR